MLDLTAVLHKAQGVHGEISFSFVSVHLAMQRYLAGKSNRDINILASIPIV
jgi:hypothetical protein